MKKIFLSLPMSGRSDEEIQSLISVMKSLFLMKKVKRLCLFIIFRKWRL